MKTLTTIDVELGDRSYPIRIGRGWVGEIGAMIKEALPVGRLAVITNPEIESLWAGRVIESMVSAGLEAEVFAIPEGEGAKTLDTVALIYDFLIERHYDRQSALVALGGGVVGDVAGFAAATFLRGIGLVQLPTSLLAMVDSSVGGKTGVNHRLGKNLIGAFKQPALVGIELDFLGTLPEAEFKAGLAEVVKYGMIEDTSLFDFIEENAGKLPGCDEDALVRLVARSCEIKAGVVAEDEREMGRRAILNFGHTFAHAAEALSAYSGVRHGEAVAMGMVAACRLGEIAGDFPESSTARLISLLERLGLPVALPKFPVEDYLGAMRSDKKVRSGRLRFVVPVEIGRVELRDDVEESQIVAALRATFEPNER